MKLPFFIAKRLRSNVRELEGALNRVIANVTLTGRDITIDFVKEALRDLIAAQERLVTIDNIQRTVAEYYHIKVSDLTSKRRTRSVARPRQVAMALAKELTSHSLPEIGVMHLVVATIRQFCMPVVKLKSSLSLITKFRKIIVT